MELNGVQAPTATESPSLDKMRWNYDDLMKCLRMGHRKAEFLEAVERGLSESEDTWRALLNHGRPGEIFLHLDTIM
eukprot:7086702-Pyramimonas_sp.AAC.1